MDYLIMNGKIVNDDEIVFANIFIKDGIISAISDEALSEFENANIIDAKGKIIFPGMIDAHIHFNDPGFLMREDFITGSMAAAKGGVTTLVDMPMQNTPAVTNKKAYLSKEEIIKEKSLVDYSFWGGFVDNNIEDFSGLKEAGASVLKAFMSEAGDYKSVDNGLIKLAMEKALELDLTLGFHCEDYFIIKREEEKRILAGENTRKDFLDSRPLIAELIATKNIIDLARETGAKVHICHVSHPDVAKEIKKAKSEGINITAETCTHYLVFNQNDLLEKGTFFKCAPPLRDENAMNELINYVIDGTLDCLVSDHSPGMIEEKSDDGGKKSIWDVWSGISGVQTSLQIIFNEFVNKRGLSETLVSKHFSKMPAKIFSLDNRKGSIEVGKDADLIIFDPEKEWEITNDSLLYKNKFSAFAGLKGKGITEKTFVRGQIVFDSGEFKEKAGYGKLINNISGGKTC